MSNYYVMEGDADGPIVLLPSLPDTSSYEDGWMLGRKFVGEISEPIEIVAKSGFDTGTLMSFYTSPPIMRRDLYEAIKSSGVDNIDVWDAIIRREDGTILGNDYKAVNILGTVSAADLAQTTFNRGNPSRMVDASIESLAIAEDRAQGLLLFRLAEYIAAVVVHRKVKEAVEARSIPNVKFTEPPDYLS